jgi:hypothetical protein
MKNPAAGAKLGRFFGLFAARYHNRHSFPAKYTVQDSSGLNRVRQVGFIITKGTVCPPSHG